MIQALYQIERVAKERAEKKGDGYGSLLSHSFSCGNSIFPQIDGILY